MARIATRALFSRRWIKGKRGSWAVLTTYFAFEHITSMSCDPMNRRIFNVVHGIHKCKLIIQSSRSKYFQRNRLVSFLKFSYMKNMPEKKRETNDFNWPKYHKWWANFVYISAKECQVLLHSHLSQPGIKSELKKFGRKPSGGQIVKLKQWESSL